MHDVKTLGIWQMLANAYQPSDIWIPIKDMTDTLWWLSFACVIRLKEQLSIY